MQIFFHPAVAIAHGNTISDEFLEVYFKAVRGEKEILHFNTFLLLVVIQIVTSPKKAGHSLSQKIASHAVAICSCSSLLSYNSGRCFKELNPDENFEGKT